eukprot:6192781-Pleurochrysis_carterae.AAC.1
MLLPELPTRRVVDYDEDDGGAPAAPAAPATPSSPPAGRQAATYEQQVGGCCRFQQSSHQLGSLCGCNLRKPGGAGPYPAQ